MNEKDESSKVKLCNHQLSFFFYFQEKTITEWLKYENITRPMVHDRDTEILKARRLPTLPCLQKCLITPLPT